jgi:Secretion system C-terminal sorting domain
MKHATFVVLFVLIAVTSSFAQPDTLWTLEGDFNAVASVPEGGLVVGGSGILVRLDEDGNELWTQELPFVVYDIDPGRTGGFIMSGTSNSYDPGYVVKMTSEGNVVWNYVDIVDYQERFDFVVELPDGGAALHRGGWSGTGIDRLDANGDFVAHDGRPDHQGKSMELVDGGVLIAGETFDIYWTDSRYSLWKLGANAQRSWYHRYGHTYRSVSFYAFQLSNGMLMSLGNLHGTTIYAVSLHRPDGPLLYTHFLPPSINRPAWATESAGECILIVGFDAIVKYDIDFNRHWLIPQDQSWVRDSDLANDGGLLVINGPNDGRVLTRYEPEAVVTVETDTQVVPPDHSDIYYTATIDNILIGETVVDVWSVLWPPEGDPIVSETSTPVTLVPGETLVHEDSLVVLAEYPTGEYMCRVHVGDYEHDITMGANTFEFVKEGVVTAVGDANDSNLLPDAFALTAYPNPFNASTTISLELPTPTDLRLAVYNVAGREVAVLNDGPAAAGMHQFTFNAGSLASGVYFVRAVMPEHTIQRKIMLLR